MFSGLDDIDWSELRHAYGSASDVPALLRALADGEEEPLNELFGNIHHQGTVYEATSYAVPFLIEVLDANEVQRDGILALLRAIADGSSYHHVHRRFMPRSKQDTPEVQRTIETELEWVRAARAAVIAGTPSYLRIIEDDEAENDERLGAAYVLSACTERADEVALVLAKRLRTESDSVVRGAIVHALVELDRITADVVERGLADADPLPRLMAVIATPSDTSLSTSQLAALARDSASAMNAMSQLPAVQLSGDAFHFVLRAVGKRWDARAELVVAWLEDASPAVRKMACEASGDVGRAWRPGPERLLPALTRCLADDAREVRWSAAWTIAEFGRAARPAADALWALVERERFELDDSKSPAHRAFESLCRIRDPRAAAHLAERLERLAPTPKAGLAWFTSLFSASAVDRKDGTLWLIDHIGPWAEGCLAPLVRLIPRVDQQRRIGVISAIGRYGEAAAFAIPAIRAQVWNCPHIVTRVLGTLGPLAKDALADMQRALRHDDALVRVNAARAVWRMGGPRDLALSSLREAMLTRQRGHGRSHALDAIGEIGPAAAELASLLPQLFEDDDDWVSCRSAIAYWRVTGEPRLVVPVLVERHVHPIPAGFEAVQCLKEIGLAARAALPPLHAAVTSELREAGSFNVDTVIDRDQAWRELCASAIGSIEQSS
jgi:HEAT repeat protein